MKLKPHNLPGMLIVFEGIDGCGKGTQLDKLYDDMRAIPGWSVDHIMRTKQPGGTAFGDGIRKMMFEGKGTFVIDKVALRLLFQANHVQNVQEVILPALREGKIVLMDRYAYSDYAYGSAEAPAVLYNSYAEIAGPQPDLLFHFFGDPAVLLKRAQVREVETHQSKKRWNNVEEQTRIQGVYFDMFTPLVLPGPLRQIDVTTAGPEQVFCEVRKQVYSAIKARYNN